jgi:hypothetical protein
MLVEGGLGFNELNEMAENCGSSLQVGTFLSFSPINQIPGFDSLSGANTEWALVHDWETLSPSLQSAVVTDRSQPTQDLVRRIASEYRTASVGEIVLDTLCKKMSGEKPSDFTVISRNTSGPHPICVQYKEGVFTIGLPIDIESEEMGIFLSRTL